MAGQLDNFFNSLRLFFLGCLFIIAFDAYAWNQENMMDSISFYVNLGDTEKFKGDMESALENWMKAASYRKELYPNKSNYHHAWKYAHLSNYHYEKINTINSKAYADTCLSLIKELSLEQQKEIEIYKIWNILAQSHKQTSDYKDMYAYESIYSKTLEYYEKSIEFLSIHVQNKHALAQTYHLYANAHLDMTATYVVCRQNDKR